MVTTLFHEFTIVRWKGGYASVYGRLPDATLVWRAGRLKIYVKPDVLADGVNVLRSVAFAICEREKVNKKWLIRILP